jgi:hypothetical protein
MGFGSLKEQLLDQQTFRVLALTIDFYVFTIRFTTRLSAVLFSMLRVAKTWNVRALFLRLICHSDGFSSFLIVSDHETTPTVDVAPVLH